MAFSLRLNNVREHASNVDSLWAIDFQDFQYNNNVECLTAQGSVGGDERKNLKNFLSVKKFKRINQLKI